MWISPRPMTATCWPIGFIFVEGSQYIQTGLTGLGASRFCKTCVCGEAACPTGLSCAVFAKVFNAA